jgi:hypothetical protein
MARTAKEIEAQMWAQLQEIRAREAAMTPAERRWEARINGPRRAKAVESVRRAVADAENS